MKELIQTKNVVEMAECVLKIYRNLELPTSLSNTKLGLYICIAALTIAYYHIDDFDETIVMRKTGIMLKNINNLPLKFKRNIYRWSSFQ